MQPKRKMKADQQFHQLHLIMEVEVVVIIMEVEVEAITTLIIISLGQDICILLQLMHIHQ